MGHLTLNMRPARAEVGSYVEKVSAHAFILGSMDCTVADKYRTKIMCIATQKKNKLALGIGKIFFINIQDTFCFCCLAVP
jgi:hypothetical protein